MNIRKKIFFGLFAIFVFSPLTFASGKVHAQQITSSIPAPRISDFDVEQVRQLAPGAELNFTPHGTPGGIATISIPGAAGGLLLEETEKGLYEGIYTVKLRDRIVADGRVTANLRVGEHRSSMILDQPLLATSATQEGNRRTVRYCASCGVVEAINEIEVKGEGNYLGMIAGGLAGALLGNQVGGGSGKTLVSFDSEPEFRVGDRVKVENGTLVRNQ